MAHLRSTSGALSETDPCHPHRQGQPIAEQVGVPAATVVAAHWSTLTAATTPSARAALIEATDPEVLPPDLARRKPTRRSAVALS